MIDEQFDKTLFNLSQKTPDHSVMPFNEAAWQNMEQLLDGEKDKKRHFFIWWWLMPLLLVGSGAVIYFGTKKFAVEITNIGQKNTNIETPQVQTEQDLPAKVANTEVLVSKDKLSSVALLENHAKKENILPQKAIINTVVAGKNEEFSSSKKNSIEKIKSAFVQQKNSQSNTYKRVNGAADNREIHKLNITKQQQKQLSIQLKQIVNINNNLVDQNDKASAKIAKIKPTNIAVTKVDSVVKIDSLVAKSTFLAMDTTNQQAIVTVPKIKKSVLSKFELSALVVADLSTVRFKSIDKISSAFGVGLSYGISKRLSIATGFVVSRKLYTADSTDYENAPTWGNPIYKLQNINANCLVYEVPLNIQYQFRQNKKNSWYAIGGLSTYFMKNEVYDYNFIWYAQTRKISYTIADKNNQLLSVLNLAVGYRRQFSNKLSYQLTPFLKIPLTGIGEGKVALYSAGLQLSINLHR